MISRRNVRAGAQNTRSGGKILESNQRAKTSFHSRNLRLRTAFESGEGAPRRGNGTSRLRSADVADDWCASTEKCRAEGVSLWGRTEDGSTPATPHFAVDGPLVLGRLFELGEGTDPANLGQNRVL